MPRLGAWLGAMATETWVKKAIASPLLRLQGDPGHWREDGRSKGGSSNWVAVTLW